MTQTATTEAELLARVRTILRRGRSGVGSQRLETGAGVKVQAGDVRGAAVQLDAGDQIGAAGPRGLGPRQFKLARLDARIALQIGFGEALHMAD